MSGRPEKGTPEWDLWVAAIEVAIHAPLVQGENVYAAKIPWSTIDEVRTALDAVGIDWRTAWHDEHERMEAARRRLQERKAVQ